jgi:hypothetical protein
MSFNCCIKKRVSKIQESLGIGPSLYLLSLKSYIRVFFLVSLLSIPQCILLSSGNHVEAQDAGGGFFKWFSSFTLGNIGQHGDIACGSFNVAKYYDQ